MAGSRAGSDGRCSHRSRACCREEMRVLRGPGFWGLGRGKFVIFCWVRNTRPRVLARGADEVRPRLAFARGLFVVVALRDRASTRFSARAFSGLALTSHTSPERIFEYTTVRTLLGAVVLTMFPGFVLPFPLPPFLSQPCSPSPRLRPSACPSRSSAARSATRRFVPRYAPLFSQGVSCRSRVYLPFQRKSGIGGRSEG